MAGKHPDPQLLSRVAVGIAAADGNDFTALSDEMRSLYMDQALVAHKILADSLYSRGYYTASKEKFDRRKSINNLILLMETRLADGASPASVASWISHLRKIVSGLPSDLVKPTTNKETRK